MPNHYHFLLRQETEVPLSQFIGVLFNAYVQAMNRQQGRKGTLFEGRFKHVWVRVIERSVRDLPSRRLLRIRKTVLGAYSPGL